jgi:hypothetical protein
MATQLPRHRRLLPSNRDQAFASTGLVIWEAMRKHAPRHLDAHSSPLGGKRKAGEPHHRGAQTRSEQWWFPGRTVAHQGSSAADSLTLAARRDVMAQAAKAAGTEPAHAARQQKRQTQHPFSKRCRSTT